MTAPWYFDMTKSPAGGPLSGLNRVGRRLFSEAAQSGVSLRPVVWSARRKSFVEAASGRGLPATPAPEGVLLVPGLFSEKEYPGLQLWLQSWPGRKLAICHDLIPLQYPETTWPHSVARHPHYLKGLLAFDDVLAISSAVRRDLARYWELLPSERRPRLHTLTLGANRSLSGSPRQSRAPESSRNLLTLGIIEPRKDPLLILEALRILRDRGETFHWHLVGRPNPHFGKPIMKVLERSRREGFPLTCHRQISDADLDQLWQESALSIFASRAEGFGLPVFESLWEGVPVITSPVPALESLVSNPAVEVVSERSPEVWAERISRFIKARTSGLNAVSSAFQEELPRWSQTWQTIYQTGIAQGRTLP